MQRWTALLFALLLTGSVGLLVFAMRQAPPVAAATSPADGGEVGDAAPSDASPPTASPTGVPTDAGLALPDDPGSPIDTALGAVPTDAGATLLTGEAPPPLPPDAPKSVVWGCIIVQYRGAQGAPANARTRAAALARAQEIAADAKQDFKAAVAKGDKGSQENVGRIQRNFLEPAPEYVLFSLPKEGVSDPVDTPRGFWIIKRID